jgi:16S rRNA C967 or C1407 C5-methylase (RsmB/RsmF family)
MAKKSAANKGPEGFESFYSQVYGERWPALRASLGDSVRQVARINQFADGESVSKRLGELSLSEAQDKLFAPARYVSLESEQKISATVDPKGLLDFYFMDPASIAAANALEVQEGDEVLDLCAAPGGKSLVLAEQLRNSGRLVSNEMSDKRRGRLRAVLEDYLPPETLERVTVTGHDGVRWCLHETEAFDRVLVDAPCSGERHLLADASEMKLWSPARSKNLAVRQYALLASAHAVVRKGGRIVYSTCSISPLENDAVIARLLKKREGEVRVLTPEISIGEKTEHGWMLLPDLTGYGPIYFAVLERVSD